MKSKKKYTITDVADMLGVSRATVSRALNGTSGVGPELREKIVAFANEIGYRPNPLARSLTKGRVNIVGLVFGDVRNPFYSELTFYIQKALERYGYTVMIFNNEYDLEREARSIETAKELCLAGLILFTVVTDMEEEQLRAMNIPIIFVNRTLEFQNYDSVLLDNFRAGYIATMHLIELGHQRIGFIKGHQRSSVTIQRYEGYRQALKTYYLTMQEEDIFSGDLKMKKGYEIAGEFFAREQRPSAMLIGNDLMALGFMDWCKEHGIEIPKELSLVSFDNIDFSALHGFELTTISQKVEEMGEKAAELMVRRIEEPDAEYRRIILEPELIIRKTTREYQES